MKKIILTTILLIAMTFVLFKVKYRDESNQLTELILNNVECLAFPEDSYNGCYWRGTLDCPRNDKQVMYYL